MKTTIIILLLLLTGLSVYAQKAVSETKTLLMTGASFASKENGWFEIACEAMDYQCINRAIGGKAISDTANQMEEGTLYSRNELDQIDALVIMHVHNRDVFDETNLKENYKDYPVPFDRSDYAAAYDYVIKRFITECYELKDDPESRYYGTATGKAPVIILCTHWHSGRTVFNASVRKLAEKWGLPLVEFDRNIGFNARTIHPATGASISLLYAQDSQDTNGTIYGWHPKRGKEEFIQQKMAGIFAGKVKSVFNR